MRAFRRAKRQPCERQRGMTVIGMLLLMIVIGFVALIAMKVVPMYVQYYAVKAAIESVRKGSPIAQMSPSDIHDAIDKRFYTSYVNREKIRARDFKITNDPKKGRVLELVYNDEQSLFYGLFIVLKVDETVSLNP